MQIRHSIIPVERHQNGPPLSRFATSQLATNRCKVDIFLICLLPLPYRRHHGDYQSESSVVDRHCYLAAIVTSCIQSESSIAPLQIAIVKVTVAIPIRASWLVASHHGGGLCGNGGKPMSRLVIGCSVPQWRSISEALRRLKNCGDFASLFANEVASTSTYIRKISTLHLLVANWLVVSRDSGGPFWWRLGGIILWRICVAFHQSSFSETLCGHIRDVFLSVI